MNEAKRNEHAARKLRIEATIEDSYGEPVITLRTLAVASLASALLICIVLVTAPVASAPTTQRTGK